MPVCNPNYLESGYQENWENWGLRSAWAKVSETSTSISRSGIMAHTSVPSYTEAVGRRISVQACSKLKLKIYLKTNLK
jgi:hypothetical protein